MISFDLTVAARLDFHDALDYIALRNPDGAARWERRMLFCFMHLAEWPNLGRVHEAFSMRPLRLWTEGDYVVLYDVSTAPLTIVAVLHGSMDLNAILIMRVSQYDAE